MARTARHRARPSRSRAAGHAARCRSQSSASPAQSPRLQALVIPGRARPLHLRHLADRRRAQHPVRERGGDRRLGVTITQVPTSRSTAHAQHGEDLLSPPVARTKRARLLVVSQHPGRENPSPRESPPSSCCPPEQQTCPGPHAPPTPPAPQIASSPLPRSVASPASPSGQLDVLSNHRHRGHRLKAFNKRTDPLRLTTASPPLRDPRHLRTVSPQTGPPRADHPREQCSSVFLPDPEGPITAVKRPGQPMSTTTLRATPDHGAPAPVLTVHVLRPGGGSAPIFRHRLTSHAVPPGRPAARRSTCPAPRSPGGSEKPYPNPNPNPTSGPGPGQTRPGYGTTGVVVLRSRAPDQAEHSGLARRIRPVIQHCGQGAKGTDT
ncbi:hypothetical protein J3A78_007669 [Streptomyces sp. PvR006]|nr:hypothetical protein [Streptomyces sp. PvR006]